MILRQGGKFSVVDPEWSGRTVVCFATGPSLTPDRVELVRDSGVPAIAVNDAYLLAPFAQVVYFADLKWWKWQQAPEKIVAWQSFVGQKCTINSGQKCPEPGVHVLENARDTHQGLSTNPAAICTGANSGYQVLNIATLSGAKRIVLVGYDCRDVGGKSHFFGEHPDGTKPPYDAIRMRYREAAEAAKRLGIEVLNATPGSALDMFESVDLAESLQSHPARALV